MEHSGQNDRKLKISERKPPDPKEIVKLTPTLEIPRDVLATLKGIRGITSRPLSESITQFVLWGLESFDWNTGDLPEHHPVTGRSKEEILNKPKVGSPGQLREGAR